MWKPSETATGIARTPEKTKNKPSEELNRKKTGANNEIIDKLRFWYRLNKIFPDHCVEFSFKLVGISWSSPCSHAEGRKRNEGYFSSIINFFLINELDGSVTVLQLNSDLQLWQCRSKMMKMRLFIRKQKFSIYGSLESPQQLIIVNISSRIWALDRQLSHVNLRCPISAYPDSFCLKSVPIANTDWWTDAFWP